MADAHTTALRNLVGAFGGNPPDWLRAEYGAACSALNTPDPVRDAAPDLLHWLKAIAGRLADHGDLSETEKTELGLAFAAIDKAEGR